MENTLKPLAGPVFIVGSPRSGTSILTWCLGQHPNVLGLEESNWMAQFAVDAAAAFRRGSYRGERSQIASMGISREMLLKKLGRGIDEIIIRARSRFEDRRRQNAEPGSDEDHPAFKISRAEAEPKHR